MRSASHARRPRFDAGGDVGTDVGVDLVGDLGVTGACGAGVGFGERGVA
jgi:hypothetical protein